MAVNLLDVELYQYAPMLFEQQVLRQGGSFARGVKSFQRANQRLSAFVYAWWETWKVSVRVLARRLMQRLLEATTTSSQEMAWRGRKKRG
jgi:hypothetical protein